MIEWHRPNGTTCKTNDEKATVKCCESLGWTREKAEKPKRKSRRKAAK